MEDKLVNISDIYSSSTYDFSGAKVFDKQYNYNTKSMLVIPMKNKQDDLIGVIQLIDKKTKDGKIVSFNSDDEMLIYSMGSQATMMLENHKILNKYKILCLSIDETINTILDEKNEFSDNDVKLSKLLDEIKKLNIIS
jgi:hypothetical protein